MILFPAAGAACFFKISHIEVSNGVGNFSQFVSAKFGLEFLVWRKGAALCWTTCCLHQTDEFVYSEAY